MYFYLKCQPRIKLSTDSVRIEPQDGLMSPSSCSNCLGSCLSLEVENREEEMQKKNQGALDDLSSLPVLSGVHTGLPVVVLVQRRSF